MLSLRPTTKYISGEQYLLLLEDGNIVLAKCYGDWFASEKIHRMNSIKEIYEIVKG